MYFVVLTSMQPQMQSHVGSVSKTFVAVRAGVGALARVGALVLLQQHLARERLTALAAHVRLHSCNKTLSN